MAIRVLQRQAGKGEQGQARNYTPEHMESPEISRLTEEMTARRASFERSNHTRMESPLRGVGDLSSEYEKRGWTDIEREHGAAAPSMHDYARLAAEGHNIFPQPTRFEELSEDEQARAHAGLKAHGTSYNRLVNDLGRGLDRAYTRATRMGGIPAASNFYEPEGFARQELGRRMEGAPSSHHAAAISMTSPLNKFLEITQAGAINMPNVNAAVVAGQLGYSGRYTTSRQFQDIPGSTMNEMGRQVSGGGVGIHGNVAKAAFGLHQGHEGVDVSEWRGFPSQAHPEGDLLFGKSPKASPFAASFIDEAAPFHVTDVHMASIGLPHLSGITGSGQNINPSGADTGKKSERDIAIERIPHAHAVFDHAMRTAMGMRGLEKTRFQQGAGWGEEQIHRTLHPEPGAGRLNMHPDRVYGWQAETMPHTALGFTRRSKAGVGDLYLPN